MSGLTALSQGALRCKVADMKAERDCAKCETAVLRRRLAGRPCADFIPVLPITTEPSGVRPPIHLGEANAREMGL
jgi:hypothetical protein